MAHDVLTHTPQRRNRNIAGILLLVAVGMVGAAYAAVPLYEVFCKVTGYGGTPRVAGEAPKGVIARQMTTRFDANIGNGLAWQVTPAQPVTAEIGTVETIVFVAHNLSDRTVTGTATFNVTPDTAGAYFNKIQCFCFTEQTLEPGATVEMPVTFFVDPEIDADDDLRTIRDITLSYTFYASEHKGS
jgi:cytochrome c oxidase assembly protein subunit 11